LADNMLGVTNLPMFFIGILCNYFDPVVDCGVHGSPFD
jgi:hypothetical protein